MARIDEALDDVLGDPPVVERDHPHRIPLGWSYERRGGSVPPRPAHCLSPVRQGARPRHRDRAPR
jgi:hypothetical protein